jgi:hypothetical protein
LPGCRDDEAVWYAGADENLLMRRQTGELVAEDDCMTVKQRDDFFRFHKFVLGNFGLLIGYCLDNWIRPWFPWVEINFTKVCFF